VDADLLFISLALTVGVNWRLQDVAPTEVAQFEEDEILVVGFGHELPIGEGVLTMDFTGTLNDEMRGFYRRWVSYVLSFRYVQDTILDASFFH
jgi:puromycin-sensitive aminopeptidase